MVQSSIRLEEHYEVSDHRRSRLYWQHHRLGADRRRAYPHHPGFTDHRAKSHSPEDRIFYHGDIGDTALLERIFREHPEIYATVHCAALIIVPESTAKPYEYYRENVGKSIELFHNLNRLGCKRVVFSSSASLYDTVPGFMVTENSPLRPD